MNTIERILDLIEKNNISARKLTQEAKLSSSAITEWRNGKANPSYGAIIKIADYFNVNPKYLLCETDDQTPPDKKAHDTVDEPIFITMQSYYTELPVKDKEKMDRVLKAMFEEAFPKNKDNKAGE